MFELLHKNTAGGVGGTYRFVAAAECDDGVGKVTFVHDFDGIGYDFAGYERVHEQSVT